MEVSVKVEQILNMTSLLDGASVSNMSRDVDVTYVVMISGI